MGDPMKLTAIFLSVLVSGLTMAWITGSATAEPAKIQTPSPVIYLADNLDEQDKLGWCIDTVGRGFSERLHAHSCKPQGGDVQFKYDASSNQIMSVAFEGKCAEMLAAPKEGVKLGLLDCKSGSAAQQFSFDAAKGEFRPGQSTSLCLIVGEGSRSAGPFMSRDLALAAYSATNEKFKRWIIRAGS